MFVVIKVTMFMAVLHEVMTVRQEPKASDVVEWAREFCKATDEEIAGRIVGGEDAPGIIKYQLFLQAIIPNSNRRLTFKCGAAPINLYHVVTAAHCVMGTDGILREDVEIYGGVHVLSGNLQNTWQTRKASHVIPHPEYAPKGLKFDIAILKVEEPFNFGDGRVAPIQLPTNSTPLDGEALISGWGCTQFDKNQCKGTMSRTLKKANVPLWSHDNCVRAWAKSFAKGNATVEEDYLEIYQDVMETMVCAGGNHVGSCYGDSGGPLVVMENGNPVIIGITAFSNTYMCGCDGVPTAYTKVLSYLDWIKKNTIVNETPTPPPSGPPPSGPPPSGPPSRPGSSGNPALKDLSAGNLVCIIWLLIQKIMLMN